MVRYNSRPRRSNRRSHYNKKRPNRMGQVLVIGVVAIVVLVYFFNKSDPAEDPNSVVETDINDVVNNLMSGQGTGESRSVMDLPGAATGTPGVIVEPNTSAPLAPPKREDMNAGANPEVESLFARIMAVYNSDSTQMVQVRDALNKALRDMSMSLSQDMLIKDELARMADIWLFGNAVYPDDPLCDRYLVKSGDNLERIGKNNDVPYQLLMQINSIKKAASLQAGVQIKVVNGPFHAVVKRSDSTMDLYLQDTYVKTFVVGLGRPGKETPTGQWQVGERLSRPPYWDPDTNEKFVSTDPEYPIGPYYIKLKGISGQAVGRTGFAIHGTNKPAEIGMKTSSGCIRLHNERVEEIYRLLAENKSEVRVDP
ncbi:MAG: L,D-transpeptidase family protein [Planctomycetes bacterium]|nr:L,D-transpeptidase family protein [Planctomycetota bacterium]